MEKVGLARGDQNHNTVVKAIELISDDIQVLGEEASKCMSKYKAPDSFPESLGWWIENWREYVEVKSNF